MTVRGILCALVLATALGACSQSEGGVCQVDDDCDPPLRCNASTQVCQPPGSENGDDAGPPADAALPPDTGPVDAPPPPIDAAEPDAAEPDAMPE